MKINIVSPNFATQEVWDVVVVGTSFAAMFFVHALPKNLKVLLVEKGNMHSHQDWLSNWYSFREDFKQDNTSGLEKTWVAHSIFGGNSNCWWGQVPRFHPNDFRTQSLYGIGRDWPISYDFLEPFYTEVEEIMEVAGGGSERDLPRSKPFPFPPHKPSLSDAILRSERPDIWFAAPTARSNGGSRAICCTSGICSVCPIDAKFTVSNGLGRLDDKSVSLLLNSEAKELSLQGSNARSILVQHVDGRESEIFSNAFALGANAIFNVAILMRSNYKHLSLGCYLHEQLGLSLELDVVQDNYFGGTSISGHGYGFYDGTRRSKTAAVLVENFNAPASLRSESNRWTQRLRLKLVAEDIPSKENRVELDKNGKPSIKWKGHDPYSLKGLNYARDNIQEIIPFEIEGIASQYLEHGEAHIQGSHRMGNDPNDSVVDKNLRVHNLSNVLALGAGTFPSCSPANPTLTLSALSLMAGRLL